MAVSPLQRYQESLDQGTLQADASQLAAVQELQALYQQLLEQQQRRGASSWLTRIGGFFRSQCPSPVVRGLYLWGGVGRGKTFLMDIFFDALPLQKKMRTHFHRFMRHVHGELKLLKKQPDPLEIVAIKLARDYQVICFDEFFVVDITDAMILAGLLRALFERGVTLVATSNIAPDGLYQDGLQRARFLPAIALLNQYTKVINVDGGIDYRLRALQQSSLYYTPNNADSHLLLRTCFERLVPDHQAITHGANLEIEGREIPTVMEAEDVVWFDFKAICDGPRSQNDYIEIAREYHAVLVQNVPAFGPQNDDQARRFIYLVDEFYDRNVKLVISASLPILQLYASGGRLQFEFQRTASRLQEMQSTDYLRRAHRP